MARSAKPPKTKICPGRKVSPWTVSLTIEGAIKPCSDDTEELPMKAPTSESKPVGLGQGVRHWEWRPEENMWHDPTVALSVSKPVDLG